MSRTTVVSFEYEGYLYTVFSNTKPKKEDGEDDYKEASLAKHSDCSFQGHKLSVTRNTAMKTMEVKTCVYHVPKSYLVTVMSSVCDCTCSEIELYVTFQR